MILLLNKVSGFWRVAVVTRLFIFPSKIIYESHQTFGKNHNRIFLEELRNNAGKVFPRRQSPDK